LPGRIFKHGVTINFNFNPHKETFMTGTLKLTEEPELVDWPETHYVFVERIGPFHVNAPQAWADAHKLFPAVAENNTITGYMSLYKMGPEIYRAGVALAAAPVKLPEGLTYEKFAGGKYCKFVLTGPYQNLGEATGRTVKLVAEKHVPLRDGYNIENYVNDPRVTPEDELVTEILFPAA
jgi:effector-binding domain-containing protein